LPALATFYIFSVPSGCSGCSVGQKRRHFGDDSNLSMLNNEKMKQVADNIMILDYNQYVSQYLSV